MVRRVGRKVLRARIVETEAYLGPQDLASHSVEGSDCADGGDVWAGGACVCVLCVWHALDV